MDRNYDEHEDLLALLLDHRADAGEARTQAAHAVATASMGENHLWQDMGLPHRQALSELLRENFPSLVAKNTNDMKWKKFFYRQLCERADVPVCKVPACAACNDYEVCFGPES